jgi:tetratricopeptide (TPR) repeat protein
MRELLGELLLQQQRPAEALTAFEASLKASPNRFRGFLGAARAAKATGDDAKARQWYGKLLELVGERNGRAEIAEALAFVKGK